MTADEEIFEEALTLSPADRAALLDCRCAENTDQRVRLQRLLDAHGQADDFLLAPAVDRRLAPADEKPGDTIDRYKLVEQIGEGGWGVVWLAQQDQPLRRQLALKIVKLGMDTKAVIARFAAERQAVAMMDHPNIARLYDAGVTAMGRPYFVMELVRGAAITRYCDTHRLSIAQRLELFIDVCDAVQHAHQKGLIHRDLKPSNILVSSDGGTATPKVIDFGIAKAIQGPLTDDTVFTAVEQFVGTPVYMSPEQADMRSLDVDTRSDIYSLGVLLFELLTGGPPFDSKMLLEGGVSAMRQRLQETEPARPSVRISTLGVSDRAAIAERRGIAPHQLPPTLRGDLDWIVMRCLEKDRTRRYESASALGQDLRRYLRNEPVLARPPSRLYIARKLMRRHRVAVAGISATLAMLIAGGGISAWQAVRATRAEREQSRLRSVAEAQEQVARRRAYAADMNLAQQALANGNLGLARRLLDRHRPKSGELDLRGWEWRYLWQQGRSEAERVVARKTYPVSSLSRSPDGEWIAMGQADGGELSLHHLKTNREIRLALGVGTVRALFSPVEPLLAIAFATSRDRYHLRLWNVATQQTVAEWASPVPPGSMFFSSDGKTLAMVGEGRGAGEQIVQWRIPTGETLNTAASVRSAGPLMRLAVHPDAQLVAREVSSGTRGVIQVLDLATGIERWSATASEENISAFAFSADGRLLASAAGNNESSIRIWDVATGKPLGRLEGHRTYVAALLFSPDGQTLVSAGTDQTVRLWNLDTWDERRVLRGHELEVHSLTLLPDETTLVSGAKDGTVLLWNTAAQPPLHHVRFESVANWKFHAGGQALVTLDSSGQIVRHAGRNYEHATPGMDIGRQTPGPARAVFSPDRPWVAVNSDGAVQIFDWREGKPVHRITTGSPGVMLAGFPLGGKTILLAHDGPPDGRHGLHEWSLENARIVRSWPHAASPSPQYILSPDGRRCIIRRADGSVTLIDLPTGSERLLPMTAPTPATPAFSPDGQLFATPSTAGWAKIWKLDSTEPIAELSGFILGVHSVIFSSDGKRLVTGSGGSEAVRVWDAASFEPLLTLSAQGTRFASIAFSSDGTTIGGRNALEQLHLWRAPSWAEIEAAERSTRSKP